MMIKQARISECGRFRLNLTRDWDGSRPRACVIMLNPSTADAEADDPTIRKLLGFGQRLGWGGFEVVNLFSYRATKPADLRAAGYPGQTDADDRWIASAAMLALDAQRRHSCGPLVICAWGANARGLERPAHVLRLLREREIPLHALRLLPDGIPAHPLMLPYTCTPVPYAP